MDRMISRLALFLALVFCFQTLQTPPSAFAQGEQDTIRLTMSGSLPLTPGSLNFLTHNTQEGLMRKNPHDKAGGVMPGLAASYDVSADGLTYTFHLRNTTYSDGTPIIADDFVYAWERFQAAEPPEYVRSLEIRTLTAVDDSTVQATFAHPGEYLIRIFGNDTITPIKRSYATAQGDLYGTIGHTQYSGPFQATEYTKDYVVLTKNTRYWDAANVHYKRAVIYRTLDAHSSALYYQSGMLDEAAVAFSHAPFLGQEDWLYIPSSRITYLNLQTKTGPLANKHIRRALMLSFDQDIYGDQAMHGLIPRGIYGTSNEFRLEHQTPNRYDLEQARSELAVGLSELGLSALPTLTVDTERAESYQYLTALWKDKLGIDVQVVDRSFDEIYQRIASGESELSVLVWSPDFNDPSNYLNLFRTDEQGYPQRGYEQNPLFTALMKDADTTRDRGLRMVKLADAERLLLDEAVVIPLYSFDYYTALQPYVDLAVAEWSNTWDLKTSKEYARPAQTVHIFNDAYQIPTYAQTPVEKLLNRDVVGGVGSEMFAPGANVTRAQFLKMIIKSVGLPAQQADTQFTDVDGNAWYAPYVETAVAHRLVQGSRDVSGNWVFRPNAPITRAEMATILNNAYRYSVSGSTPHFTDTGEHWAKEAIRAVRSAGAITGYPDGSFHPNATAMRADAATVVYRAFLDLNVAGGYELGPAQR